MTRLNVVLLGALIVSGCSTALTESGSAIRSVGYAQELQECDFLGVITAKSPELAITPAQEAEYAINDARNKVAAAGGTHMKLLTENHGAFTGSMITAEVYRCEKSLRSAHP